MREDDRAAGAFAIRAVGERQVVAVAEFQTMCWQQAYRGIVSNAYLDAMDLAAKTQAWRERVVSGRRKVAAAWDQALIVRVVSWIINTVPDNTDELNTIYVDATRYGNGLAQTLLHVALGARPARLWVFEANLRARRFYSKHGFVATGAAQLDPDTSIKELEFVRS